jgi:hypothetical protein
VTILYIISAFASGYYIGKRIGVAQTMLKVQAIIYDLQQIENSFKQWNEDKL